MKYKVLWGRGDGFREVETTEFEGVRQIVVDLWETNQVLGKYHAQRACGIQVYRLPDYVKIPMKMLIGDREERANDAAEENIR